MLRSTVRRNCWAIFAAPSYVGSTTMDTASARLRMSPISYSCTSTSIAINHTPHDHCTSAIAMSEVHATHRRRNPVQLHQIQSNEKPTMHAFHDGSFSDTSIGCGCTPAPGAAEASCQKDVGSRAAEMQLMLSSLCRDATADERPADSDEESAVSKSPSTGMWPVGGAFAGRVRAVLGVLDDVKRQYRAGIVHDDLHLHPLMLSRCSAYALLAVLATLNAYLDLLHVRATLHMAKGRTPPPSHYSTHHLLPSSSTFQLTATFQPSSTTTTRRASRSPPRGAP